MGCDGDSFCSIWVDPFSASIASRHYPPVEYLDTSDDEGKKRSGCARKLKVDSENKVDVLNVADLADWFRGCRTMK